MTRSGVRLPISFSLAACTTVALFWFLGMLVSVDLTRTWIPVTRDIRIVRVPVPEPDPIRIPPVKPPIVKPEPRPDLPNIVVNPHVDVIRGTERTERGLIDGIGKDLKGPLIHGEEVAVRTGSDRGPIPQVRIEPEYPESAKDRGIEGWITFSFTVAKDGSVKDVAILDAQPPRVWDSATRRAVSSWKYQPAIKDGKPVEQAGVTVTYRYELER